jgi:hypothetical protein
MLLILGLLVEEMRRKVHGHGFLHLDIVIHQEALVTFVEVL